ncbi:type II toxin-antitoxin system VapC family toxin [Streptomyces sp. A7024]|uniref:Ribonuclease VapC n=1 Tax=Streptomyces coryli TaxID=1128680 RepID=A0A6G4U324_9ACTN|nr:type II toxin-antitoxin system VapC family toxin [Streptomyces coryli]
MAFLVDTNVFSELRRRKPDSRVVAWVRSTPGGSLFTSTLVVGEIRKGIENVRRRDERQAARLESWLEELRRGYADRLLPVTADVAERWGRFSSPDPLPVVDGLLAATAAVHGLTLVTRNVKDVGRTGVPCLDPFAFEG